MSCRSLLSGLTGGHSTAPRLAGVHLCVAHLASARVFDLIRNLSRAPQLDDICHNAGVLLIIKSLRAAAMRLFFVVLCACGGQAAFMPSQPLVSETSVVPTAFALPDNPSFSEFLGINDRGDIAVAAGVEKPTHTYVGHMPYGQRDFKRRSFPVR